MEMQNSGLAIPNLSADDSTEICFSDWLTVTQERINSFASATEDRQWIHLDAQRALTESPFGSTVAHGFLILSLLSHFISSAIEQLPMRMGVNYGLNRVRFITPVPSGTRIRGQFKLLSVESIAPMGGLQGEQMIWAVLVEREGSEKPACVAEWITRRYV